jgi:hypothetical protein
MDALKEQFPESEIFRDIDTIKAGTDFVEAIDTAVKSCSVLLAVIGPRWLSATDNAGKRRIDDSNDFVRLETGAALRRNVHVIPILVEGATMPSADELPEDMKPLARRQAHELSDRRWDYDTAQLVAALEMLPGIHRKRPAPATTQAPAPHKRMRTGAKVGIAAVILGVSLGVVLYKQQEQPVPPADWPVVVDIPFTEVPPLWEVGRFSNKEFRRLDLEVVGGQYRWGLEFIESGEAFVRCPCGSVLNFYAAVDARMVEHKLTTTVALLFGWGGGDQVYHAYAYKIRSDNRFALIHYDEKGTRLLLDWTPVEFDQASDNRMAVLVRDQEISLYLNGKLIAEYRDPTYAGGHVGLQVEGLKDGATVVEFDNFELRRQR